MKNNEIISKDTHKYEVLTDTVETRSLEVEGLSLLAHALLSGAQRTEILYRLGDGISE